MQEFSDLDPLLTLTKLETLSLLTNPITTNAYYREYIAYKYVDNACTRREKKKSEIPLNVCVCSAFIDFRSCGY